MKLILSVESLNKEYIKNIKTKEHLYKDIKTKKSIILQFFCYLLSSNFLFMPHNSRLSFNKLNFSWNNNFINDRTKRTTNARVTFSQFNSLRIIFHVFPCDTCRTRTFVICSGILVIRVTPDTMRADNRPVEATGSERAGMNMAWLISHGRLQLIYNSTGTRSSCDNRNILLYYRENSRSSWERVGSSSHSLASNERFRLRFDKTIQITVPYAYIYSCIYSNIYLYK